MTRSIGKPWRLAALAALAVFASAAPGALAGPILVGGGYIPHGDPTYTFVFDVTLKAGYTLNAGDSFTIDGLPGVSDGKTIPGQPLSLSGISGPHAGDFFNPMIDTYPVSNTPPNTPAFAADVTWKYGGSSLPGRVLLGEFTIQDVYNYPPGSQTPFPSGETSPNVTYTYNIDGQTGSGSFIMSAVPEPSSILLLLIGGAIPAGAGLVLRRRSRRAG